MNQKPTYIYVKTITILKPLKHLYRERTDEYTSSMYNPMLFYSHELRILSIVIGGWMRVHIFMQCKHILSILASELANMFVLSTLKWECFVGIFF